jgi:hypothetical protein
MPLRPMCLDLLPVVNLGRVGMAVTSQPAAVVQRRAGLAALGHAAAPESLFHIPAGKPAALKARVHALVHALR